MSESPQELQVVRRRRRIALPEDVAYGVDVSGDDPASWREFGTLAQQGKLERANMRSPAPPKPEPRPKAP